MKLLYIYTVAGFLTVMSGLYSMQAPQGAQAQNVMFHNNTNSNIRVEYVINNKLYRRILGPDDNIVLKNRVITRLRFINAGQWRGEADVYTPIVMAEPRTGTTITKVTFDASPLGYTVSQEKLDPKLLTADPFDVSPGLKTRQTVLNKALGYYHALLQKPLTAAQVVVQREYPVFAELAKSAGLDMPAAARYLFKLTDRPASWEIEEAYSEEMDRLKMLEQPEFSKYYGSGESQKIRSVITPLIEAAFALYKGEGLTHNDKDVKVEAAREYTVLVDNHTDKGRYVASYVLDEGNNTAVRFIEPLEITPGNTKTVTLPPSTGFLGELGTLMLTKKKRRIIVTPHAEDLKPVLNRAQYEGWPHVDIIQLPGFGASDFYDITRQGESFTIESHEQYKQHAATH